MASYADAKQYKDQIGRRAQIIESEDYAKYLHGKTGEIREVNGCLYLKFDTPAVKKTGCGWEMLGAYLTTSAYKLEE